jgi:hypothetical protein
VDVKNQEAEHSTAIRVEAGERVGEITVLGNVAGRDVIVTEDLTYDVNDLTANPYLGLASYTYATRALYGGRDQLVREAVARVTAPADEPVLVFVTGASGSGKSSFSPCSLLTWWIRNPRLVIARFVGWVAKRANRTHMKPRLRSSALGLS